MRPRRPLAQPTPSLPRLRCHADGLRWTRPSGPDPPGGPGDGSNPGRSPIARRAPSPEPLGWEEPGAEASPPFQASLVVERGSATGTTYLLGHIENVVGSAGAAVELPDDPH